MADQLVPITPDNLDIAGKSKGKNVILSTGEKLERISFEKLAEEVRLENNDVEFSNIDLNTEAPVKSGIYMPTEEGNYTNFGNLSVTSEEIDSSFVFFVYNGSEFTKQTKEISVVANGKVEEGDTRAVSGSEIHQSFGILKTEVDLMPYLKLIPNSFIYASDGSEGNAEGYSCTAFLDVNGMSFFEANIDSYQQYAFYDENKSFIAGSNLVASKNKIIEGAKYVRFSVKDNDNFFLKLSNKEILDSENIVNKDFTRFGQYIDYATGNKVNSATYCYSDFTKVEPITEYRINITLHLVNYPKQICFYDSELKFISGTNTDTFTTPSNCKYIIYNVEFDWIEKFAFQIVKSNVDYYKKPFSFTYWEQKTKDLISNNNIIVGKSGEHFSKIMDAVNEVSLIGDLGRKPTINIKNGLYEEVVNIAPYYVDLIGESREGVIILDTTGKYSNSPLNVSARNNLTNLTSKSINPNGLEHTTYAYGVHADSEGEGVANWFNCIFESDVNSGIGLGLQNNQQYIIRNCVIRNNSDFNNGGGLYMHNAPYSGMSKMSVILQDNTIYSKLWVAIMLDDANANAGFFDDTDTYFTFIRNYFWSEERGKTNVNYFRPFGGYGGDVGQIKFAGISGGNNIDILNKQD